MAGRGTYYGPTEVKLYLDGHQHGNPGGAGDQSLTELSIPTMSIGDFKIMDEMIDTRGFGLSWSTVRPLGVGKTEAIALECWADSDDNSTLEVFRHVKLTGSAPSRTLRITWGDRKIPTGSDWKGVELNGAASAGDTVLTIDATGAGAQFTETANGRFGNYQLYVSIHGEAYRVTEVTGTTMTIDRGPDPNRVGLLRDVPDDTDVTAIEYVFRECEGYVGEDTVKFDRDNLTMLMASFTPTDEIIGSA